jgi:hypothetical protein
MAGGHHGDGTLNSTLKRASIAPAIRRGADSCMRSGVGRAVRLTSPTEEF